MDNFRHLEYLLDDDAWKTLIDIIHVKPKISSFLFKKKGGRRVLTMSFKKRSVPAGY